MPLRLVRAEARRTCPCGSSRRRRAEHASAEVLGDAGEAVLRLLLVRVRLRARVRARVRRVGAMFSRVRVRAGLGLGLGLG